MRMDVLPMEFTVCQVARIEAAMLATPYTFLAHTEEEISLVCPAACVPHDSLQREDGWRCMKAAGPLDFSLIGILANIARVLAEKKISIFALSTYNTDYVLVKEARLSDAIQALREAGYEVQAQ